MNNHENSRNFYRNPYQKFYPKSFRPEVSLLGITPRVFLTKKAYDSMVCIVNESRDEVGWLGEVERSGMNFLITDIYLFEQEVHTTENTLDPESLGTFFNELLLQDGGVEKVNAIRFWGHSHVNMTTSPSGTYGPGTYGDLVQMYNFGQNGADYFIMGIANKSGDLRFEVFLYDLGIRVQDVPWQRYEEEDVNLYQQLREELAMKVRTAPVPEPIVYEEGGDIDQSGLLSILGRGNNFPLLANNPVVSTPTEGQRGFGRTRRTIRVEERGNGDGNGRKKHSNR